MLDNFHIDDMTSELVFVERINDTPKEYWTYLNHYIVGANGRKLYAMRSILTPGTQWFSESDIVQTLDIADAEAQHYYLVNRDLVIK